MSEEKEKVVNLPNLSGLRQAINDCNDRIIELENALYTILDVDGLEKAKEIAAEALGEDLETYLEEEVVEELDFEDDGQIPWDLIPDGENH
jgi:hypothetical protein